MLARLRPTRDDLIDAAFTIVACIVAVIGFRTTFAGHEELSVGVPAVLAGVVVGHVVTKIRPPLLVGVSAGIVAFFVLSAPIAMRHRALGGAAPTPGVATGLADGLINGWIELLTTLPPAGQAGDLLAIPYASGFTAGALAIVAARSWSRPWCLLPPTALLVGSVLMGTRAPAALWLQGAGFAVVALAWMSVRHHRTRDIRAVGLSRARVGLAVGMVAIAAVGGSVLAPALPGGDAPRYVLRDVVEPPFDPLEEASPLVAFRNYTDPGVRDDDVVTVSGLPEGARLRIGVLDDYDGLVWRASGSGSVTAGEYLRVGATIPVDWPGDTSEVTVEILRPEGVWVPLAGDVRSVDFTGDRGAELDDDVRISIQSDAGAVPSGLRPGDTYRFRADFVEIPDPDVLAGLALDGRFRRGDEVQIEPTISSRAAEWGVNRPTEYGEVLAMAESLVEAGAYSDGGPDAVPTSPPGHSLARLVAFLGAEQPVGNGEQYAAALGAMATSRGIPARVVMGFVNADDDGEVTFRAEDVSAWVEVPVDGLGWVPVDTTPPTDKVPDQVASPRARQENPESQPPPPTTAPPPTSIPDDLPAEKPEDEDLDEDDGGFAATLARFAAVIGIPLILILTPIFLVLAAKRRRRQRRRTQGTPSSRVAGSFAELVDFARDTGAPVPPRATRDELARVVDAPSAVALAERTDRAVFGAGEPDDVEIDAAWDDLTEIESEWKASMSRPDRVRRAVSLTSLRQARTKK